MTGRCGPCCSVEPTGTMTMASSAASALSCGAVWAVNSSCLANCRPLGCGGACMGGPIQGSLRAMNYTFRFTPVIARIDKLLDRLATTLWLSAAAIALGFLVGLAGALAAGSRSRPLRGPVLGYVEAIRNTPLLAQLFFIYFGLPALGLRLEALTAALLTLVINL